MQINRYLELDTLKWLSKRMVFIGGPRQVGKTTFSKSLLNKSGYYMSWDDLQDRNTLKKHQIPANADFIIIDEIHKYPRWRMLLKGFYDKLESKIKILITGSARLDHFRKGGDSLFGRYHYFRMHPLSINELLQNSKGDPTHRLLNFGGFPEPFIEQDKDFLKIWQRERRARIIEQDLRDLTNLKDYNELDLLADILPSKVGSLLSTQSIAEDLEKSPHTIKNWIKILESVYHCYLVLPYGPPKIKAIKKQPKIYLWDWSEVEDLGPRFENMVASHLLKYCHYLEDTKGHKMELRFLKDQYGREVDFVVLQDKKPIFAVECKSGEEKLSPHLVYYKERTNIPKFYQVHLEKKSYQSQGIEVLPFKEFCKKLNLV